MRPGVIGERDPGHGGVPSLAQGPHAGGRAVRMSHDAAAGRDDQVGRAEPRVGAGSLLCAIWPDEKTGITVHGLWSNSGVRQARAEAITLSSDSENLFCRPLTCMWSAPASRQIFCHATIGPAEQRMP